MKTGEAWSLADLIPAEEVADWELKEMREAALDLRRLPLKKEIRGFPGFGVGALAGFFLLSAPWFATMGYFLFREHPDGLESADPIAAASFGLLGLLCLLPVLAHLVRRETIEIDRTTVSRRTKGLLGTRAWKLALTDFRGLLVHYPRYKRSSPNVYFHLSLVADGGRRLDVFSCKRGDHVLRVGEVFADALGLPLLAGNVVPSSYYDDEASRWTATADAAAAADKRPPEPRLRHAFLPGRWSARTTARFPGPMNVYGRDLKSFLADATAVATGREMEELEETDHSVLLRADPLCGDLTVELCSDQDKVRMTLQAQLSRFPIGGVLLLVVTAVVLPLQIVVPPFSTLNELLITHFGPVGSLVFTATAIAALYLGASSPLRWRRLRRCRGAFQQIASAFAAFQMVHAQMSGERQDTADVQPEYARLLPEGGEGFSLAPLRHRRTLPWTVELHRPETAPFLRGVLADAGFPNTRLETRELRPEDVQRREAELCDHRWNLRRPPCSRHYVLGTSRRRLLADTIGVLLTPRGDRTQVDVWSVIPSYVSPLLVLSWMGVVALAMILYGYTYVIYHGHNPALGWFFAVATGLGFFGIYPLVRRTITLLRHRHWIERSLRTLETILTAENLRRVHQALLPRLEGLKKKHSGTVVGVHDDDLFVRVRLDGADAAARVVEEMSRAGRTAGEHVASEDNDLVLFPPLDPDHWMTPDVFFEAIEKALTTAHEQPADGESP